MKKLMILLAAAAVAAVTQAASVSWTCTNVKNAEGGLIDGVAYFVNAATLSKSTLTGLDGADAFQSALSGMYSFTPTAAGKYTSSAAVSNADLGLTDATASSAYLVIFDTATITAESKYYVTEVKEFNALGGTETASIKWGSQSTPSTAAGAWSGVSSVPEPTSGLLLLLGMAGLALKRKQA